MKTLGKSMRLALWAVLLGLPVAGAQAQNYPIWQNEPLDISLAPGGDLPIGTGPMGPGSDILPGPVSAIKAASAMSAAPSIDPDVAALAEALGEGQTVAGEPTTAKALRIYNWVRNTIGYQHYHGLVKGASLTLLEGSGNDFDQCALLRDLLVAAGYSSSTVKLVRLAYWRKYDDLRDWLGLADEPFPGKSHQEVFGTPSPYNPGLSQKAAKRLTFAKIFLDGLGSGTAAFSGRTAHDPNEPDSYVLFDRVFVAITFDGGGTYSVMDPSFKRYAKGAEANLATNSGYSRAALLGAAAGASDTNSVVGMNTNATGNYLRDRAAALRSTFGAVGLRDLVQGRSIIPVTATSLAEAWQPLFFYGQVAPIFFDSVDDASFAAYKSKVRFRSTAADGLDYELPTADLRGRKVTLTFNGSSAELRFDDDTLADTGSLGSATTMDLTISITHPGGGVGNQAETKNYSKQTSSGDACSYAIIYGFDASERLLSKRQEKLKAYKDANKPDESREVRTEILNIMGLTWLSQTATANRLIASQNRIIPLYHHRFGRMAQEAGFYVDVGLQFSSDRADDGVEDDGRWENLFHLGSLFASALEHGVIQQMQVKTDGTPYDAVSTVNILREANKGSGGQKLFLAKALNWAAIKPQLTGSAYTGTNGVPDLGEFTDINNNGIRDEGESWTDRPVRDNLEWLINNRQAQLFLPANGTISQGIWSGSGWVIRSPNIAGMIISGGYSGGYGTTIGTVRSPTISTSFSYNPVSTHKPSSVVVKSAAPPVITTRLYAGDPVDMATGAFVFAAEDMATGTEGAPRGLAFTRNYSSTMAARDEQNLGFGWMHNLHIRAVARTASEEALGMGSPQQAAAFLVAIVAASDLYRRDASPKEWGVATLAVGWFVDQMKDNAVSVRMGKDIFQFIKQPDGSFTAPPGSTMILTTATDGTYRLQQRLGNTIEFDTAGKATRIVDVDSRAMTFAYNTNNTLNYVQDAGGRRYTFAYNGTRITGVTDSTSPSRSVTFGYDTTNWNLTSVTDPEGKVSYFDYSVAGDPGGTTPGQHRIVRLRNHDGETITQNVWDSLGRVERQFLHGDTNKAFRLYYTGRENFEVNPQGGITRYFYDERLRPAGSRDPEGNTTSMTYDGQDRVVTRTSGASETTAYTYDAAHNLTRVDHPRGGGSTLMAYDSLNRLDLVIDPNGVQTDYVYFASGPEAAKDRPQSVIAAKGTAEQSTTTYTYTASGAAIGRVSTITDGDGLVTTKTYDTLGQPDITTLPGGFSLNQNYSAQGNLDSVVDANGRMTSFTYNKRRQRTGETADTSGVAATANATFDNQARVATITPPADNAGQRPVQSLTYNPTDKVRLKKLNNVTVEETAYDSRDWASTAKDAANRTTTFVRKANGDLAETQRPASRTTKFFYDGDSRVTSTQNPGANSGTRNEGFVYDTTGGGKPRTVKTEADGRTVTSEYDAAGRLRFVTDRKGATFEFGYDALGRRTTVVLPTGQTTTTTHTKNGRVATQTEPSGDKATFNYNAGTGRLASAMYAGAGGTTVNYTGYDANGNLLSLNEGGNGTITRTYDGLNRVTSYTEAAKTIGYRYYASGKLAKVIYPGGTENGLGHVEYTYNADGRLYQVIDRLSSTSSPRTTTYSWNSDGRLASVARPNGTVRTISYDTAGRPSGISDAGIVWGVGYWPSDDIKTLDVTPPVPARRLAPVPAAAMTFDDSNGLLTFNGQTIAHDADGNSLRTPLPAGGWADLTYDSRNRLTGAGATTYSYNAEGHRVGITSANETTTLTVDPQGALPRVLERVKNGVRTRYVYGAGLQYEVNDAGAATYYHYDQSGNTAALTNQAGAIIERVAYSPYGTIRYRQSTFDTPFLYGGFFGVMTDSNGLINMRARYYNPLTMRFLNSDPAMDGLNWYAYANGNPINFADPTGYGASRVLDAMQGGLTALGFAPGVGAVADLVNAGISAGRGDFVGAAFNSASAMPGLGDAFAAGKIATAAVGVAVAKSASHAVSSTAATAAKVEVAAARGTPTTAIQPYFPANNGFLGATERQFLMPGQVIDRYGGTASSRFFSPAGTSEAARALPAGSAGQPIRTFEVMKPFEVDAGTVAPAFVQPGLGTQFRTPVQLDILLKRGILQETTP